ncbi:MAG: hypothetical protein ACKO3K_10930 [Cuspidothrix sp.]
MKEIKADDATSTKILADISPEVLATLTDEQKKAIYNAFVYRYQNNHAVNIRYSIPIPGLRLYLLLLTGSEKCSLNRLRHQKILYPILTPINILFLSIFGSVIIASTLTILSFIIPLAKIPSLTTKPASIPWIDNQYECQNSGRYWEKNKCWDKEHSPDF